MQELGKFVSPKEETMSDVEHFVCSLYGKPTDNINSVHYSIFCKAANLQSHHLSPTLDALKQHIMRATIRLPYGREPCPDIHCL